MDSGSLAFEESSFKDTTGGRFLFVSPSYEEAFATVRYGIDARKGLILVTGAAGTGKTTLLRELQRGLEPHVQAACIFDSRLSYTALLQETLKEFGLSATGGDRPAMMGRIYEYSLERLELGHIVTLMVDDAQNLKDETLEELRLLSNFETHTDKLIQIVLLGKPEFEAKLDQHEFFHLKQRVVLRSRLRPLEGHEVGLYIESKLKAGQYTRQDIFDSESVELIAFYSNGIPRLINTICDAALLQVREKSSGDRVSAIAVEKVARDLGILESAPHARRAFASEFRAATGEETSRSTPNAGFSPATSIGLDPRRELGDGIPNAVVSPVFFKAPGKNRRHIGISILLMLLVAGGIGFILYPKFFGEERQPVGLAQRPKAHAFADKRSAVASSAPQDSSRPTADQTNEVPNLPSPAKTIESRASQQFAGQLSNPGPLTPREKRSLSSLSPPAGDPAVGRELETEIYKAIHDRAIRGVQVSVSDGTVYLDGRVATRRQKVAAVRATLSVPGVKRVQNEIVVGW